MSTIGWLLIMLGIYTIRATLKGQVFAQDGTFTLAENLSRDITAFITGDKAALEASASSAGGGLNEPITTPASATSASPISMSPTNRGIDPGTTSGTRPFSPTKGYNNITQAFGVKNSRYAAGWHTGVDYAAPQGTPVLAVVSGRITRYVGGAYGLGMILRGSNGSEYLYAHLSVRSPIGRTVTRGEVIGKVGSTGSATGPHLHLEQASGSSWSYGNVKNPTW
jgi:murein DD-endopeptidase MepM/ murein hydrolase activator NlpD